MTFVRIREIQRASANEYHHLASILLEAIIETENAIQTNRFESDADRK
jgi:hypothetical protein